MCSALSPDRYPRPRRPRAFVYHDRDPTRAGNPACGGRPRRAGRAGERAFRGWSPRLTSPPSHHSRTRRLNLVLSVPAPSSGRPGPRLFKVAWIGACGACGRDPAASSSFCWRTSRREVGLPWLILPAPLKVIWRTRGSAPGRCGARTAGVRAARAPVPAAGGLRGGVSLSRVL